MEASALGAIIEQIRGLDADACLGVGTSDAELRSLVVGLAEARSILEGHQRLVLAEFDARQLASTDGARSTAGWVSRRTRERRSRVASLVKTGRHVNDELEILSGLDAGDSVVVDNPQQLVDGQPLREK